MNLTSLKSKGFKDCEHKRGYYESNLKPTQHGSVNTQSTRTTVNVRPLLSMRYNSPVSQPQLYKRAFGMLKERIMIIYLLFLFLFVLSVLSFSFCVFFGLNSYSTRISYLN